MELLAGLLIAFGLTFVVAFLDQLVGAPVRTWAIKRTRRLRARWRRWRTSAPRLSETFQIGGLATEWIVLEGDCSFLLTDRNIACRYRDVPAQLPREIRKRREQLFHQRDAAQMAGKDFPWCSKVPRLIDIVRRRTDDFEDPLLILHFGPSDYYTFLATSLRLDDPFRIGTRLTSLRERYLDEIETNGTWDEPVDPLASSFGIYITIITADGRIPIVLRSERTVSRREYSTSVTEGISLTTDREGDRLDPFKTARRGAKEELGIELRLEDIGFLSLGVNPRYYQYALLGRADSSLNAKEVSDAHATVARDRWEKRELHLIPLVAKDVRTFIDEHDPWSSAGAACIVQTLISEFGRAKVEREFRKLAKPVAG